MLLLDEAGPRLTQQQQDAVEAVRSGTIFAHNRQAYQRWSAQARAREAVRAHGGGLTGAELEGTLMGMAVTNPDIVAVRTAVA